MEEQPVEGNIQKAEFRKYLLNLSSRITLRDNEQIFRTKPIFDCDRPSALPWVYA
jgi:hypothetical protein